MGRIRIERRLSYAAPRIWKLLAAYADIHRLHPLIVESRVEGEKSRGLGAVRVCRMKGGWHVEELAVDWQEGRQYTVVAKSGTTAVLERSALTIGVRPLGAKDSVAFVEMDYAVKFGMIGAVADLLIVRAGLEGVMKLLIRNLDITMCDATANCP